MHVCDVPCFFFMQTEYQQSLPIEENFPRLTNMLTKALQSFVHKRTNTANYMDSSDIPSAASDDASSTYMDSSDIISSAASDDANNTCSNLENTRKQRRQSDDSLNASKFTCRSTFLLIFRTTHFKLI